MSNLSDFLNKKLSDPIITLDGTEGTPGQVPISQGAGLPPVWGLPASADFQEFTSSGTWTKPDGVNFVAVHIVAGGGGGQAQCGGSGGQGLFMIFPAAEFDATEPVVVGSGGTPTPTDGGSSSFAGVVAIGGRRGSQSNFVFLHGSAGASADASNMLINSRGEFSGFGSFGYGGASTYGGGGGTASATPDRAGVSVFAGDGGIAGTNGSFPGGGGGGNGGSGAAGVVRVWSW